VLFDVRKIYEARIADLKEAHDARVGELNKAINILVEQIDYLRMTGGVPPMPARVAGPIAPRSPMAEVAVHDRGRGRRPRHERERPPRRE
jgi:hypothetical protein